MDDAPQHKPRPLPLFLDLLRSETAASPGRMAAVLRGLRSYQQAPRTVRSAPAPEAARIGRATLRDFGGEGPAVVFVPSLINPPDVLDLSAENSLLRWLAGRGLRPLLVDWGASGPADRTLDIAGHVETLLLPLLRQLPGAPHLVGYCLGGTMALAAAARHPVASLALIATPWHFRGFPDAARDTLLKLWASAAPFAEQLGLLPMEVLQAGFWQLDPARTVAKFEGLDLLDPASDKMRGFVALEDWANDGAPMTFAAARELFDDFFEVDAPGRGRWRVGGGAVDPAALTCPVLDIVSTRDRIVPDASAVGIGTKLPLDLGHVGMVVGSRARTALWEPLAAWLSQSHLPV